MTKIYRPEHPEPQFERKNWVNLNGEWEFEIDRSVSGTDRKFYERDHLDSRIIVPFCPESKLSGIGDVDFMNSVWYKTDLNINNPYNNGRTFLNFGAVDYKATIYINGKKVTVHEGGYVSFKVDITDFVNEGKNVLIVNAFDDVRSGKQPRGKQSSLYHSHGCDYTRTTGIWQTVWLEYVPESYIKEVKYYPQAEEATLTIQAVVAGSGTLTAEAFYEGKPVGNASATSGGEHISLTIDLSEKHLWELGNGRLYDLKLTYGEDEVKSYFGLRSISFDGMKFMLNGKSVFQRLVLDQGFYPDGIYTAKDEEELVRDIDLSMAMGFNGARLHEKVFEARFIYHCDKKGYMVWGEYGNWGLDHTNPASIYNFLSEWIESVERDFNHPSIVGWCPFNETWNLNGKQQCDELLATVYKATKAIDKTRPCIDTSGNFHVITDIFDLHDYCQNPEEFKEHFEPIEPGKPINNGLERNQKTSGRQVYNGEPVFLSEYGGIKVEDGDASSWGYGNNAKSIEEFYERYKGLTDVVLDNENMMGFCYTQLYDVEQEQNGLYTYSREDKFDAKIIYDINTRKAKIEE